MKNNHVLRRKCLNNILPISCFRFPFPSSRNLSIAYDKYFIILFSAGLFFSSCGSSEETYVPKPKGYFRIDLPAKKYILFDSTYPYSFEYPVYAKVSPDTDEFSEPYWMNLSFPLFKGNVNISYKPVNKNLSKFTNDAYNLAMKHIPKASNIEDERFSIKAHKVYGTIYNIEGEGTASTYQFFITDSVSNFLRGALYFNIKPNNDSLAPVIDFVKEDIKHFIKTFRWKKI